MIRPADRQPHAVNCRCPRCARAVRLRAARSAVALVLLGFVLTLLFAAVLIRSILA